MKYSIGTEVKVKAEIDLPNGKRVSSQEHDETISNEFIGKIGIVVDYNSNGQTGNTEEDPLHVVRFNDGSTETFWYEELSKTYSIPINWEAYKIYHVEASNLQEAVEKAIKQFFEEPDGNYIYDSADIDGIVYDNYSSETLNIDEAFNKL